VYEEFGQGSFPETRQFKTNIEQEQLPNLKEAQRRRTRTRYIKKSNRHLFQKRSMIYTFIKTMKRYFRLKRCARILQVGQRIIQKTSLFQRENKELNLLKQNNFHLF
jgi:hypothetical protein